MANRNIADRYRNDKDARIPSGANDYVDDFVESTSEDRRRLLPFTQGERWSGRLRGYIDDLGRSGRRFHEEYNDREYDEAEPIGPHPFDREGDGAKPIGGHPHSPSQDDSDLSNYLGALERYDRGEIDNYEMSRIQRKYANAPFWYTFRPSDEMIEQYGSGNDSTRWPMFEHKDGHWRPIIWRND